MRPFSIWQSSCPEPTALAITPQGAGCQAKDRRGQAVVLWRFDFVMLNIVPLRPKPPYGRGRNFIRPHTCFSDLRSAPPSFFTRSKNRSDSPDQRAPHPSNCSIPLAIASAILSRNASLKSICSSLAFVIKRHSTSALGIVDLRLT